MVSAFQSKYKINVQIREDGARQIFSEFYKNRNEIILNKNCIIENFIRPNSEVLNTKEFDKIKQLFLAHEMFHYLECFDKEVGVTFKQRKLLLKKIWKINYYVGIRMLSEIGAHSFSRHLVNFQGFTDRIFDTENGISEVWCENEKDSCYRKFKYGPGCKCGSYSGNR